jgi:hypothetical protein
MLLAQLGIREGNLNIVSDPFVASIEKAAKKKKKMCNQINLRNLMKIRVLY